MNMHNDSHNGSEHGHEHHGHSHTHSHGGERNLVFSIFLNLIITAAEVVGGILSGSLALLSDAFHNLSDVFSMVISYFAIQIGKKDKSAAKSYGYKRAEIIAALFNVMTLFAVCVYIIYEAFQRFFNPQPVNAVLMASIAAIGLIGNGISVALLFKSSKENINIRSAFLHLLGDTFSSVGVIITSIVLLFYPLYFLDSVISILIVLYIFRESWGLFMESINILMQGAPKGINKEKLVKRLMSEEKLRIKDIHHIHMWDITPGRTVFDAHVAVSSPDLKDADNIIHGINLILAAEFGICHSTIQIESENFNHCVTCEL